jgi:hypothetical protein
MQITAIANVSHKKNVVHYKNIVLVNHSDENVH